MFRIDIDKKLVEAFPEIHISAMRATGLENIGGRLRPLDVLADARASIASDYSSDVEQLTDDPRIASWREAYRRSNMKPNKYRSSVEALTRRVMKDQDFTTGIAIVDLYNAVSMLYRAPIGAVDTCRVVGTKMTLRLSAANDTFSPIGKHPDGFPLVPPVPVYALDSEVQCWGFNCRDSMRTALEATTDTAIFVAESIDATQRHAADAALAKLSFLLKAAEAEVSAVCSTAAGHYLEV